MSFVFADKRNVLEFAISSIVYQMFKKHVKHRVGTVK